MRAWTHDSNRSECLLNNITWPSLTHHCIEKMILDIYIYIYIKTWQTIWWGPIVWVTRDRDQLETSCPRHRNRDGRWKLWNQSAIKWDGFDPLSLQHICEAGETQPRWTATHHAMEVAWTESHADLSQPWFVGPNLFHFRGVWKISRVPRRHKIGNINLGNWHSLQHRNNFGLVVGIWRCFAKTSRANINAVKLPTSNCRACLILNIYI